jgi:hypothetical protein
MSEMEFTFEQLIAYAAGTLPGNLVASMEHYVASNPEAARSVVLYRLAQSRLASDDSIQPPSTVIEKAKNLFVTFASQRESTLGWLDAINQRVFAHLVFDSRVQAAAVRGAATADHVQLSYETESGSIDLEAHRVADQGAAQTRTNSSLWRIMGQASASLGARSIDVIRASDASDELRVSVDADGMFEFDLAPGDYSLRIHCTSGTVPVQDFSLDS